MLLAAVVALLVAVCVVLPSAPPLRHRLLRAALLWASGWQRRRLELQSTDVRHGQERRLRRLLPPGAAPGSDAFRERHPPSPCCNDRERAEPLPPLSLWAVLRSCWSAEPALQGTLFYLHALHRTFPQALTLRGTALLGWAPTASRAPGFCPLPTLYCTPPEAAALPLRSAALRVQLLFALRTRALRVLEARLPNELHDVLVALRDGWAELAHDLALGTLSPQPGLPEEMRGRLQALLVPDSTRAAELRAECERGFEGIVRRLWPQLQVVVVGTVRGGERLYCDALRRAACKGLPLYCPWYRVAGALLGVNLWPKEPVPRFVLCPEWAFCEFLPCPADEEEEQCTVLLGELWEGREYKLILTARPGEYRCLAGEVLRVAGFHKQCPVVEPVRRESQVLSVRGESIPEEQFCRSLCRAVGMWPGARLMDYVCVESTLLGASSGAGAPHYEVFVELRGLRDLSEGQRHKDGSRQRPVQKKTVSFSTMPNDRKINSADACISFMLEGCELKKVRSNSRMYSRFFVLDADMRSVRWEPSKKDSEKAKIEIKSVKEVRVGKKTPILRSNGLSDQFPDECAFSIIYGDNYESLDLVASSADVVSAWVMGLRYLLSYGKHTPEALGSGHPSLRTSWISSVFDLADLEKSGRIPVSRAVQLIKALNPGMKVSTIELKFKELQKASERPGTEVACDLFVEAYCELCTRPEIFFLLVQFSSNKEYLGLKDLLTFLEVEQGMEGVTEEKCLEIVSKYEPSKEGREKGYLAIDGFTRYLLSSDCSIFDPQHRRVCQDMAQPLSHYYISSAHSACLLEDNFWGRSDISGYVSALGLGCRSIELVLWDGPEGEPVVYTSPSAASCVPFRSVVGLIDQHAFAASAYPLILCLVVRCSAAQQRLAAQCLRKTLGEKLYLEPPDPAASYLPSPEQLKGRILIKGKKLPPGCEDSEGEVSDEEEGRELARRLGQEDREAAEGGVPRRVRLSRELSELVSLCQAVPFQDFESSRRGQRYWEMCSFSEVEAGRFANECPAELVSYNKRFLSRVYPSPMRIDASNMNPQDFWKCGCQMVAMNYQTPGLMMDLNAGWFRQNGACGYVLRPAIMREEVSYFSANAKDSLPGVPAQLLHLKVISGQNLPKPKGSGAKGEVVEPYVCAEIHGIPADCAEHRTKTALQSGDNPVFDESLEFQINLPELAVLRFVVLDDDYIGDEFIAQYTIPFECLQPGYRHVPLQSLSGEPLPHATLFVHVAITDRRGGGKGHRRGLAGRRGRRVREYTSTKATGIKAIDEVFRTATQPLREATDLRENVQNALVSFKELCGLTPAANMKQCILTVAAWLLHSDSAPSVTLNLAEQYPPMEAQGPIPDLLRKVLTAYETMIQTSRTLIESADVVHSKLIQAQQAGMDFHKELHRIEAKEGLRGRKLQKALESFAWNITVLKGQADLLKHAKAEALDNLWQIHNAGQSCGIGRNGLASPEPSRLRAPLEPIPEAEGGSDAASC